MASVKEDYKRPLKEIYESFPKATQESLDKDICKIWTYFLLWCVFVALSFFGVVHLIGLDIPDENLGKRVQRAGSIIPLLALLGESLFILNLNKLASVIHPAKLAFEIYKERRFKPLLRISLIFTVLSLSIGAVLSGYGDLLFKYIGL